MDPEVKIRYAKSSRTGTRTNSDADTAAPDTAAPVNCATVNHR